MRAEAIAGFSFFVMAVLLTATHVLLDEKRRGMAGTRPSAGHDDKERDVSLGSRFLLRLNREILMSGMSSHVMWQEIFNPGAELTLAKALAAQRPTADELASQQWDAKSATIGGVRDYMTSFLAPASGSWSSLRLNLNSLIAEPVAAELSRLTGAPAIVFQGDDEAAWGYSLFSGGSLLERFWSVPAVAEMSPPECAAASQRSVPPLAFDHSRWLPRFATSREADDERKAFEDDEFPLGDHWLRVDFMRRLGPILAEEKSPVAGIFQ